MLTSAWRHPNVQHEISVFLSQSVELTGELVENETVVLIEHNNMSSRIQLIDRLRATSSLTLLTLQTAVVYLLVS